MNGIIMTHKKPGLDHNYTNWNLFLVWNVFYSVKRDIGYSFFYEQIFVWYNHPISVFNYFGVCE